MPIVDELTFRQAAARVESDTFTATDKSSRPAVGGEGSPPDGRLPSA
jgi:hypothetical protein